MKTAFRIPFNRTVISEKGRSYIDEVCASGSLTGKGKFTRNCEDWFLKHYGSKRAMLTHTGTHALELATLLASLDPGDEVIMPSFTFVTTAQSVVMRGAIPVFVDIQPIDLNINVRCIEQAITPRTKAIMPVHYAGGSCDMETIVRIAKEHDLMIIEDAAHAILSKDQSAYVGTLGHMACLSFHETKNLSSGEGGVLLINDEKFVERAEIVSEKGTDRSQFNLGLVDKYTWQDIGSSFWPTEITAALIWSQLEDAEEITARRKAIWQSYHSELADMASAYNVKLPAELNNAHIFYCLFSAQKHRDKFILELAKHGISSVFHYIPLHSSPGGRKYGRVSGELPVTDHAGSCLARLPIWLGIEPFMPEILEAVEQSIRKCHD